MRSAESIANDLTPHITANNGSVGETNRRLVLIGDGRGNVQPATLLTPRDVLYRSAVDQNDRGIAILHPKCPIALDSLYGYANVEVYIANVPGSSQLYIVDVADTGLRGSGGATSTEGLTRTAAFPTQDRLVVGRLRLSPAGGLAILVDFGVPGYQTAYEIPSGGYAFTSTAGIDLSDPTNATIFTGGGATLAAGEHCIVGVAFDPTLGALIAIQGTPITAVDSLPSRSEFAEADYEAIDFTGFYPCGYTYNYYGQTDFVEDDMLRLYDPRLFMKVMGSGGGGGAVLPVNVTVRVVTAAGAVTVTTSDYVISIRKTAPAATVVNLPASPTFGDTYVIKDSDKVAATYNNTITPSGGDTIEGGATFAQNVDGQSNNVTWDGVGWIVT